MRPPHDPHLGRRSLPELQHVAHTNFCDIGFSLDKSRKRLIAVSAWTISARVPQAKPFKISISR